MFEIYLYRPDIPGDTTGVSLTLPATPYEMLDTLEKARITDTSVTYSVDFIACELDYKWQLRLPLRSFIAPDTNIHELNHLAHRLAGLDKGQLDCFEGMTMMDAIKTGYSPIPLERLINMTHSMEDCHVVYEAHDDTSLGKFYVDNDFPVIPPDLPEILYDMLDYESIGRKARMGEGGVFTEKGYVVQNGEIADHYHSGDAIPKEQPQYTIMLEVCKGYFNDPVQGSKFSEFPMLPADDGIINRAVAQVEAASVEECSIRAVDCIVPKLTPLISDTLYAADSDCYGAVNELATQFQTLEQTGKLYTYKAMLEAAPEDITLDEALDLSHQVEWFSVIKEANSPAAYARDVLSKYCIEQADELFASTDLRRYGEKLIAEKGIAMTGYGALWALDRQTVEQRLCRTGQAMTMEMK